MDVTASSVVRSPNTDKFSHEDASTNMSSYGMCSIREFDVTSLVIQIVIAVVILVPNVAVIKVILTSRDRRYQRSAYRFIASLCLADALVAVYVMISVTIADAGGIEMSPSAWAVMYICGSVPFYSSVIHLLVIAVDRLLYIGYYRKYNTFMTKNVVIIILSACWGLSLVPVVPVALGYGVCGQRCQCPDGGILRCQDFACSSIFMVFTKDMLFGYSFFFFTVTFIITAIYSLLFRKVRQQSRKINAQTTNTRKGTRRIKREFQLARTLAIVIVVSFLFWGPLMVVYIIDFGLPYKERIDETFANIISIPNLLNSISNPIIYAVRMKHMRQEMMPAVWRRTLRTISVDTADSSSYDGGMSRSIDRIRAWGWGSSRNKVKSSCYNGIMKSPQRESSVTSISSAITGSDRTMNERTG